MARNVNELIDASPSARRRKIEKRAAQLIEEEMTLQELRRARKMTQTKMARSLGIAQKQISEVEKRTDMHISTLRRTVEAMGGELVLTARFRDGAPVRLAGLTEVSGAASRSRTPAGKPARARTPSRPGSGRQGRSG